MAEFVEIVLTSGVYDCVDWICLNKGILWVLISSTNKVSCHRTRDLCSNLACTKKKSIGILT